jgi:hypothetical protein
MRGHCTHNLTPRGACITGRGKLLHPLQSISRGKARFDFTTETLGELIMKASNVQLSMH